MTLEERAEESSKKAFCVAHTHEDELIFKNGYLAGAKENGVVWHDLRKDPNDLPRERTSKFSIDVMTDMGEGYILYESGCWHIWKYNGTVPVSRWCEIPQFKE